jgi:hypothetical protein
MKNVREWRSNHSPQDSWKAAVSFATFAPAPKMNRKYEAGACSGLAIVSNLT